MQSIFMNASDNMPSTEREGRYIVRRMRMTLDVKHFANAILEIEEKGPESNHEYKQILGLASGNKKYLAKATLEDIADLMENLNVILSRELQDDFPHIDLETMPRTRTVIRRAI